MTWNEALLDAISAFDGFILAGPRTGLKTKDMQIPKTLGPDIAGAKSVRVASLRANVTIPLAKGGHIKNWYEEIEAEEFIETTNDGAGVLCCKDEIYYLSAWLDQSAYLRIFENLGEQAGLMIENMPDGLRKRCVHNKALYTNYTDEPRGHAGVTISAASYEWVDSKD
jgi:beta-galactosidase